MNMIPIETIDFDIALFNHTGKSIIIRDYKEKFSRYPIEESIVYNMTIRVYENKKYHITGLMVKDDLILTGEIIKEKKAKNVDKLSKHKLKLLAKKKYVFFGKESPYYWLKSGWYSTTNRIPLDITHYGTLTIIKSDYRLEE